MKNIIGFITIIFLTFNGLNAQKVGNLVFMGKVTDDNSGQKLSGVTVTLYKDGSPAGTSVTSGSGKYEIIGPPGHKYKLEFTKAGMVPKHVIFDLSSAKDEDVGKFDLPVELEMTLFEEVEGVDFSILKNKPIGKGKWDPTQPSPIVFDFGYTKQIKKEVDKLLKEAEQKRKEEEERKKKEAEKLAQYEKLMSNGNKSFGSGKYEDALKSYQEAQKLFPDKSDAPQKITETKNKIEELKNKEAEAQKRKQYDDLIASADKAFTAKNYQEALNKYNEALVLFPSESHPSDRIIEIDEILSKQKAEEDAKKKKDQEYQNYISAGDNLMKQKKYEDAKNKYQSASEVKPEESYPKDKIKEIDDLMANAEAAAKKEKEYNDLISQADQAYDSKKYEVAQSKYENALKIKPNESHPTSRIVEIKKILDQKANQAAIDKKYDDAISAGDQALSVKNYDEAKKQYNIAKDTKPTESYPKEKLSEIDALLKKEAENEQLEANYQKALKEADDKFAAKDYEGALKKYQEASGIKPDEQKPKDQIDKIKDILDNLEKEQEKEQKYQALIKSGGDLFGQKKYEAAKSKYEEASQIKPEENEPKAKIKEIEDLLADLKKQEELENNYNAAIKAGDDAFAQKEYQKAQSKFQEASNLKPSEQYPKDKIAEIKKLLDELAAKDAEAKAYNDKIKEADGLFDSKSYDQAIAKYEEASALKPDESYPKDRIKEIKDLQKNLKEQEAQNKIDKEYNDLISAADGFFDAKSYDQAIKKYEEALVVKLSEKYPKDKIAEIKALKKKLQEQEAANEKDKEYNDLISAADGFFDAKSYDQAIKKYEEALVVKSEEKYPKDKIAEIKALKKKLIEQEDANEKDKEYNELISAADGFFDAKSYDQAIKKYEKALTVKSAETYPKEQLEKIEKIKAEAKAQKELENQYQTIITDADSKFKGENFQAAKKQYEEALKLKPNENYPKEQIEKINNKLESQAEKEAREEEFNKLVADGNQLFSQEEWSGSLAKFKSALELKPSDNNVKNKIAEIENKLSSLSEQQAIDEKYDQLIKEADGLFNSESYTESKEIYKKAAEVKPAESYPQDQINKANEMLKKQTENEKQAQYQKLIDAADKKFDNEDYTGAKDYFIRAKKMNPDDNYPQQKLDEIENILKELSQKDNKDDEYQSLIDEADQELANQNYQESKNLYKKANGVKPTEDYPQKQIDKINELMKQESANELQAQYQKIIDKADGLYDSKEYDQALTYYKRASGMKPDDPYPQDQITAIKELLKTLQKLEANKDKEQKYNTLVNEADRFYESKQWKEAKQKYAEAYGVMPKDYPQNQIDIINEKMKGERDSLLAGQYQKIIDKADGLFGEEDYKKSKSYYERALGLKPDDEYPRKQIDEINRLLALEKQMKKGIDMVDYGKPVKNQSVMDGEALLLEAEAQRRFNMEQKIVAKGEQMDKNTRNWSNENYDNTIEARTYTENIRTVEIENKTTWNQISKDNELKMKAFIDQMVDLNIQLAQYDQDDIFRMRSMVETMHEVTATLQYEGDQTRKDNELKVIDYNDDLNTEQKRYIDEAYDQIVDTRKDVEGINENIATMQYEGDETRKDNELEVIAFNDDLNHEQGRYIQEAEDQMMKTRTDVEDINENIATMQFEGDETRSDNELDVIAFNDDLNHEQGRYIKEAEDQMMETRSDVENINENIATMQFEGDETRSDNELDVIAFNDDLNHEQGRYIKEAEDQMMETRTDVEGINENIATMQFEGDETRSDNELKVNDYNDELSQSRHIEAEEKYDEIIDTKNDIEDIVTHTNDFKVEADKVRENNSDDVENMNDELNKKDDEITAEAEASRNQAEDELNNIKTYQPINMTPDMANNLAKKYPEGVSEESFNIEDSEGFVTRVVTRRIVVKGNRGDVYERIQSKFGLTYTKNNKPITQYVWESSTQDATLVRHTKE